MKKFLDLCEAILEKNVTVVMPMDSGSFEWFQSAAKKMNVDVSSDDYELGNEDEEIEIELTGTLKNIKKIVKYVTGEELKDLAHDIIKK